MAIRKRSNATYEAEPDANVINERSNDARGTFDPKRSPYEGSYMEAICGKEASVEDMRKVIAAMSHSVGQRGEQLAPNDLRTQDLLANIRTPMNPGDNVERTYRNRVRSPLTGIRAFCVITCKSGSPKAVSRCTNMQCPLWAFRMGRNGLR